MALLDLFRPRWRHSRPEVRLEAVLALRDQQQLAHIALADADPRVRLAAARRLRDSSLAREAYEAIAAQKGTLPRVRLAAAGELGGDPCAQGVYAEIAKCAEDPAVRLEAIEKLTEPSALGEIARAETDPNVLLAVAGKLDHASAQRLYAGVAKNRSAAPATRKRAADEVADGALAQLAYAEIAADADGDPRTCAAVVARLTDRRVLARAARRPLLFPDDHVVRRAATERLAQLDRLDEVRTTTDPLALRGLLMSDAGGDVCRAAARQLASGISDPGERAFATERLLEQGTLAGVAAKEDAAVDERVAAARKVADPGLLALLVDGAKHLEVIEAVVENPHLVEDAPLARVIAAHSGHVGLVIAAVKKLHDPHLLARIAADPLFYVDIRRAALDGITDQGALQEVARSSTAGELALAAADRLADRQTAQRILGAFANGTASEYDRRNAISRISDPSVLAELVRNPREDVRTAVAQSASDQPLLAEMAKTERSWVIRSVAHGRIVDRELLADVARSEESWRERGRALDTLDQASVLAIARDAPFEEIRLAAVNALTDQDALGEIARGDDNEQVRVAAVRKLTGVEGLLGIAALGTRSFETLEGRLASTAAERFLALSGGSLEAIADDRILCAIAERARPPELRRRAVTRVVDPVTLVRAHPEASVRLRAVRSVTDQRALLEVVQTDPDSAVRCEAAARIVDGDRTHLQEVELVARNEFRIGRWEWDPDREESKRREKAQLLSFPD